MATSTTLTTIAEHALSGVSTATEQTFGPGEAGYVTQLEAYDKAFGEFFARLAKDGITKDNTLFVITADENDHFAGGPPSPANCDGVTTPCNYALKGEIDANLDSVIATEFGDTMPFGIHFDDAPTFYINGNPGQTDPTTRKLEREAGALFGFDILDGPNGSTNRVTKALADYAEQDLLHMITADPNRTPNFILFANPDYFFTTSGTTPPPCTPKENAASCFVGEFRLCVEPWRFPEPDHAHLARHGRSRRTQQRPVRRHLQRPYRYPADSAEPGRAQRRLCP